MRDILGRWTTEMLLRLLRLLYQVDRLLDHLSTYDHKFVMQAPACLIC